ncbi:hypothetical protein UFOVP296_9 [uncultured Caudovirales phage]|uniref:Uncharacterized protein n=1 Tax=uncultured Caudovirales phage TaxID=2100421 RepID=A0A6J5PLH4_9CAUD|nr:hypothetical protein UFOVP296_9 [uncultured Caudovirales phage]CAB4170015.1 hypothetical protein UFOVP912_28 [uncultured Caudovirales phage]CAB4199125.1 hypothetical protein UFOVP1334_16 [uncultured Caudovirales phage]
MQYYVAVTPCRMLLAGFGASPEAALADAAAFGIRGQALNTHPASPALAAFLSGGTECPSGWDIKNGIAVLSNE